MKLIQVKDTEIEELAKLAYVIWHEYWPLYLSNEQIDYMVYKFQSKEAILEQIKNENYTYFFMVHKDQKIGYVGISDKKDYLFLSKLYLRKNYRRMGFGRKAFEQIKKFGYKKIRLTVNKQNKSAIEAYLKYGFKIIDKNVADIGCGFVMDDYIMEYSKME